MNSVILIPTYNERENIAYIVPEIFSLLPNIRILVIDDNSPDGTGDHVRTLKRTYPNLRLLSRPAKQGLGKAYREGIALVCADPTVDRIITMDADGSHAVEYLVQILKASETHDLVIGSRYVKGGGTEHWEKWRVALSRWGNVYARFITGLSIHDMTAGYMCFNADIMRQIDFTLLHASGYAFIMEMKFHAAHVLGCSHYEVPIIFRARREGESKISHHIIREGLITPLRLLRYRFNAAFGSDGNKKE